MSSKSKIEWTESTWNPIAGCAKCSPGCLNCFAERMAARLANMGQMKYMSVVSQKAGTGIIKYNKRAKYLPEWNNQIICDESALDIPLHWRKPRKIFVCSMCDLFHKDVPFDFVNKVFDTIWKTNHTYQILTKRPERLKEWTKGTIDKRPKTYPSDYPFRPTIWTGVSICTPEEKHKIDILRQIRARTFISFEPLLADMGEIDLSGIDWVIIGAESGPKMRYCNPDWMRSIVGQCKAAGVPVFVKQVHLGTPEKFRLSKIKAEWSQDLQLQEPVKGD